MMSRHATSPEWHMQSSRQSSGNKTIRFQRFKILLAGYPGKISQPWQNVWALQLENFQMQRGVTTTNFPNPKRVSSQGRSSSSMRVTTTNHNPELRKFGAQGVVSLCFCVLFLFLDQRRQGYHCYLASVTFQKEAVGRRQGSAKTGKTISLYRVAPSWKATGPQLQSGTGFWWQTLLRRQGHCNLGTRGFLFEGRSS